MKLAELQTREPVRESNAHGTKTNFRTSDGWALDFHQGLVTLEKGELVRLVPIANVAWMIPEAPPK